MNNDLKQSLSNETRLNLLKQMQEQILADEFFIDNLYPQLKISKSESELLLTISITCLDFASLLKSYLQIQNGRFWEGITIIKHLYLIFWESHNKLSYRIYWEKGKGEIDKCKLNSLWYSKICNIVQKLPEEDRRLFQKITHRIDAFRNSVDWEFVCKIRNRTGHYSDPESYISDMLNLDINIVVNTFFPWFQLMSEMKGFILEKCLKSILKNMQAYKIV